MVCKTFYVDNVTAASLEQFKIRAHFWKTNFRSNNRFVFDTIYQIGHFEKIRVQFLQYFWNRWLNTVKNERLVVSISLTLVTTNGNKLQVQGQDFSPKMSCSVTLHIFHISEQETLVLGTSTSACPQWRVNSVWATNPIDWQVIGTLVGWFLDFLM